MTKKISKLLTTEEVNHLVDMLKAEKNALFSIEETDETITVTCQNEEVFKSLSKGNKTWITRFNEDLFTQQKLLTIIREQGETLQRFNTRVRELYFENMELQYQQNAVSEDEQETYDLYSEEHLKTLLRLRTIALKKCTERLKKTIEEKTMTYYAVKKGKTTGIFTDWELFREQVTGTCGAEFQSFDDYDEAEKYLEADSKETKIICLCGSTKFKKYFESATATATINGHIVVGVGVFVHDSDCNIPIDDKLKKELDELHLKKIDLSDEVWIVNPGGYVGESTQKEIEYAKSKGKKINYLCGPLDPTVPLSDDDDFDQSWLDINLLDEEW